MSDKNDGQFFTKRSVTSLQNCDKKSLSMDQKSREPPSNFVINHILQAIAHVRKRKARPDLDEICRQMKRRQNWLRPETEMRVEELLDLGIILRVEYKHNFSYRDPSDLQTGHVSGLISNTEGLVEKLQQAIDGAIAMIKSTESAAHNGRDGNSEIGASIEEIEAYLENERKDDTFFLRLRGNPLKEVLASESNRCTVIKTELDGTVRYSVGTRVTVQPRESRTTAETSSVSVTDVTVKPESESQEDAAAFQSTDRQRPPSGRKRRLKYDDSTYELPPIKKTRKPPPSQIQTAAAGLPNQTEAKATAEVEAPRVVAPEYRLAALFRSCNELHQMEFPSRHEGQEHEMLFCNGCKMKAHPGCLNYSAQLLVKINRQTWRCVTCKKCARCGLQLRTPSPLTCSGCDLAYHKSCHKPIIRKKPKEGWLCMKCMGTEAQLSEEEETACLCEAEVAAGQPPATDRSSTVVEEEAPQLQLRQQEPSALEGRAEVTWDDIDSQDSIPVPPVGKPGAKDTAFPPTPRDSPSFENAGIEHLGGHSSDLLQRPSTEAHYDPQRVQKISRFDGSEFPDPSLWTVDQVHGYISSFVVQDCIYTEGAEALRREAIDGECLMYLSRDDVLKRFSLKVGPALKLFRLIKNMQTNGNAHKYMYAKS